VLNLGIIAAYLAVVLTIGVLGHRLFRGTGEDYFLASRSIGPFVLLMSLFGTHMTAFSLLGASGEAYHRGIGVFSLMASSSALVVPVIFYFIGRKLWAIGQAEGFVTQIEFFRERWGSPLLGTLLLVLLVALLIPYLLIGIMGGGITFAQITDGLVPQWLGSLIICAVVVIYVTVGGIRSTAWVNTFQTLVFMLLGAITFTIISRELGGLGVALGRVDSDLLIHGDTIRTPQLVSYLFIPMSAGMFPHLFMHWLTARRRSTFSLPVVAYPICVAIVWIPSVLLGVLGNLDFPGLEGPAANGILIEMLGRYAPGALAGLLAAGVFAAVMSSLDSQALSLGTLFSRDVLARTAIGRAGRDVQLGRLCVVGVLLAAYALSLVANRSIFGLGIWSFSGFAGLFPLVVAALYWKRSTRAGAIAAVLVTAALWTILFMRGSDVPGYSLGGSGWMPVTALVATSTLTLVVVSLLTSPPSAERVARFFPETPPPSAGEPS
jgi:SSS family solute:Na+ symporter